MRGLCSGVGDYGLKMINDNNDRKVPEPKTNSKKLDIATKAT